MGMDQYLLIPFLGGWTSIYQLFWCSPGVQGFDTLPDVLRSDPNPDLFERFLHSSKSRSNLFFESKKWSLQKAKPEANNFLTSLHCLFLFHLIFIIFLIHISNYFVVLISSYCGVTIPGHFLCKWLNHQAVWLSFEGYLVVHPRNRKWAWSTPHNSDFIGSLG